MTETEFNQLMEELKEEKNIAINKAVSEVAIPLLSENHAFRMKIIELEKYIEENCVEDHSFEAAVISGSIMLVAGFLTYHFVVGSN